MPNRCSASATSEWSREWWSRIHVVTSVDRVIFQWSDLSIEWTRFIANQVPISSDSSCLLSWNFASAWNFSSVWVTSLSLLLSVFYSAVYRKTVFFFFKTEFCDCTIFCSICSNALRRFSGGRSILVSSLPLGSGVWNEKWNWKWQKLVVPAVRHRSSQRLCWWLCG